MNHRLHLSEDTVFLVIEIRGSTTKKYKNVWRVILFCRSDFLLFSMYRQSELELRKSKTD